MSARIDSNTPRINPQPVQPVGSAPAQVKAFDPAKVAQQPKEVREDAFTQALKEATDGDASEAEARGALGLSDKDGATGKDTNRVDRKDGQVAGGAGAAGDESQSASSKDPLTRLRQQAEVSATESAESVEEVDAVNVDFSRISQDHNNLMTLVDSLDRQQLATHVAQEAAAAILGILSSPLWEQSEGFQLPTAEKLVPAEGSSAK